MTLEEGQAPSTFRIYSDSHVAKSIVFQLKRNGIDAIHCHEAGMADASDEEHLAYATTHRRTLLTNDQDFLRIHGEWQLEGKSHAGIFYILENPYDIGSIVREIVEWSELISGGAAELETDVYNLVQYI